MKIRYLLPCVFTLTAVLAGWQAFAQEPAASVPTTQESSKAIRLVLVGDSTVCNYPDKSPNRGWGQFIEEKFADKSVTVINRAASGRSTKSFISEGRWKKALADKPDIVLIQFGHNDSHATTRPEATDPEKDYKENLRKYIDESRAIGAMPILVTPMVRRIFDEHGKIIEPEGPRGLDVYASSMKAVGSEKNVPVIDLYSMSKALAEKIGPEASLELANKKGDSTHFNEKGARAMAGLVMQELPSAAPQLKPLLKAQ